MLCALRQIKQAQEKIFQKSICSYQGLPLPYSEVCPVLLFIAIQSTRTLLDTREFGDLQNRLWDADL